MNLKVINLLSNVRLFRINEFFTKGHNRSLKTKKNIVASIFIYSANILINLLLVPLTIHYLNPTKYGIWLTLTSIVSWFTFFDLGLGNGLRNKFAEALAKGNKDLARIYLSTTYAILSIIIIFVFIIFLIINPFLHWNNILNTSIDIADELSLLVVFVFGFFCIRFILNLVSTILIADQKPAISSLLNLVSSFISLIIIYILIKTTSGSLLYIGISISVTPVIVLLFASLFIFKNVYKEYTPSIRYVKFRYARELTNIGLQFFIIQIAVVILYSTSNVIITQLYEPAEVTPFNIVYKYFSIVTIIFNLIVQPFWSAYTEAYSKGEVVWIKNSIRKLNYIWFVFFIATIIMLIFSKNIYEFWIGKKINIPFMLSLFMALYVCLFSRGSIYVSLMNGISKIRLQLLTSIVGIILNIPLAIFFCKYLNIGSAGVILSTTICMSYGYILAPIQYNKIISGNAKGIWIK